MLARKAEAASSAHNLSIQEQAIAIVVDLFVAHIGVSRKAFYGVIQLADKLQELSERVSLQFVQLKVAVVALIERLALASYRTDLLQLRAKLTVKTGNCRVQSDKRDTWITVEDVHQANKEELFVQSAQFTFVESLAAELFAQLFKDTTPANIICCVKE